MEVKEIVKEMVWWGYELDVYSKYLLGKKKDFFDEIRWKE